MSNSPGQHPQLNLTMAHKFCSIFIPNTVKQGRSLTHMVNPEEMGYIDEKQHVRSKSEVSAKRMLKGIKHFSQSVMVSNPCLFLRNDK